MELMVNIYFYILKVFLVLHGAYLFSKQKQTDFLDDIEIFTLMLSAICHDVDHTGNNNYFE